MKRFACGQVVPGCTATFHGNSNNDILTQVAAHARKDHGLTDIPDELVSAVVQHIVAA
jgi:predicted small metal-binding protein